ncbi:MAG: helix-turn-helix domain-containing protein, partial [Rhizomicrobium sp.]
MSGARKSPGPPVLADHSAAELGALAARAWALTSAEQFGELAGLLGWLLPGLEATAGTPDGGRAELQELIAVSYQACSAALAKLGEPEAAWIAADR